VRDLRQSSFGANDNVYEVDEIKRQFIQMVQHFDDVETAVLVPRFFIRSFVPSLVCYDRKTNSFLMFLHRRHLDNGEMTHLLAFTGRKHRVRLS
jgi:hypothetical protein